MFWEGTTVLTMSYPNRKPGERQKSGTSALAVYKSQHVGDNVPPKACDKGKREGVRHLSTSRSTESTQHVLQTSRKGWPACSTSSRGTEERGRVGGVEARAQGSSKRVLLLLYRSPDMHGPWGRECFLIRVRRVIFKLATRAGVTVLSRAWGSKTN